MYESTRGRYVISAKYRGKFNLGHTMSAETTEWRKQQTGMRVIETVFSWK